MVRMSTDREPTPDYHSIPGCDLTMERGKTGQAALHEAPLPLASVGDAGPSASLFPAPPDPARSALDRRGPAGTGDPRSYGWVNTSPAPISILGDALATTLNNGLDGGDHPSILIMHSLGRWRSQPGVLIPACSPALAGCVEGAGSLTHGSARSLWLLPRRFVRSGVSAAVAVGTPMTGSGTRGASLIC